MLAIGPHLRPLQLGGGLSHGAGIGARMGGLFLHREGSSVMSVDIENASNSTRHRVIYDILMTPLGGGKVHPSVRRFLHHD